MLDFTHDPAARSWVESANADDTDFPLQNLPFGRFRRAVVAGAFSVQEPWRIGVAIGAEVLDLAALAPQKLDNTLAFMVESRWRFRPTEFALRGGSLDAGYAACWAQLSDRFPG